MIPPFILCLIVTIALCTDGICASALKPKGKAVSLSAIKSYSILLPEKPNAQESYSASMLAEHLETMLGKKLPIKQEPAKLSGKFISIGNTSAAKKAGITPDPREQAYKLAVKSGNLFILGGTRGPVYGVIALLEEDLGCRWYAIEDKLVVPKLKSDTIALVPRSYCPVFEIRELLYESAFDKDWATFNRIQPASYFFKIPYAKGGDLSNIDYFIHTYDQLIPAKEYFDKHPEYFPLRNGKRHPSTQNDGQLCYTNSEVADTIAATLDAEISKNPYSRIYSVSANDNVYSDCECPECQKIIKSEDGLPGAQLYLANEVARRLAVKHPNIKITTLAYVDSQEPTKTILPGPNTVMFYAPIRQRGNAIAMLKPIGEIPEIAGQLAGWHKIAKHIYLWDYTDRVGPTALPDFEALDQGWPFLVKNGVTGVFLEGQLQGRTSLAELKVWLYTKKMWNPNWSQDDLIKEFMHEYYGPAEPDMTAYYRLQMNRWNIWHAANKPGQRLLFEDTEKQRMHQLLTDALAKCSGKPRYQSKIEKELLSYDCLMLSRYPTASTAGQFSNTLDHARSIIEKLDIRYIGEGYTSEAALNKWASQLKKATENQGIAQYSPNSIIIKEPQCPVAKYTADPLATGGMAARQVGANADWGVQWLYDDFIDRMAIGKPYVLRIRARPEFAVRPEKSVPMFGISTFSFGIGSSAPAYVNCDANDDGNYSWIDVLKLQVDTTGLTGYLYSLVKLTEADAVWFDYIELVPVEEYKDNSGLDKLPLVVL